MKIIKRNGAEEVFDIKKIVIAVTKADSSSEGRSLTDSQIEDIAEFVEFKCNKLNRAVSVEEIQDLVEDQIMATGAFELAKRYVRYRYKRSLVRKANTTDNRILSLIECNNEDVKQENSNKNPAVNSVQRDYMAGEVSRDLTQRMLLPEDIVEADKEGIIHFHDSDYYAQHMHNCDLVNLEDMLQNGTVISGTMIEKPHSFSTACNIATQIIAQVASNQYGGPRGEIIDTNGTVLATNRTVCTISVIHSQIKEPEVVIKKLSKCLGMEEAEVRKRVEKSIYLVMTTSPMYWIYTPTLLFSPMPTT